MAVEAQFFPYPGTSPDLATNLDQINDGSFNTIAARFLNEMRAFLYDEETKNTFRMSPEQFTRDRILTFERIVALLLYQHSTAIGSRLDGFFREGGFGEDSTPPTASAFCQARMNINPYIFVTWMARAAAFFYQNYEQAGMVQRWRGRRLFAVDGSKIHVPDTEITRLRCTIHPCPHSTEGTVQAMYSLLYDVLNKIPINCAVSGKKPEKQFVFEDHLPCCPLDAVVLFDRLYNDFSIMAANDAAGVDWIIRGKQRVTFKQVEEFAQSDSTEAIVTLTVPASQKKLVRQHQWPESIQVRLVKITLSTGETEILITSLLDAVAYPAEEFGWVYQQRWGVEGAFKVFKTRLEAERFSSSKPQAIAQDIYAMAFLMGFESILDKEQDAAVRRESTAKGRKWQYQLKKSAALNAINARIPQFFVCSNFLPDKVIDEIRRALIHQTEAIRPDRTFPRPNLTPSERLNYNLYQKKR
jgi:hypothetical protein